ncbi:MAG: hypothetical protein LBH68_00980, partial [Bifidobacteriaceae bacterium]|nr:hypothetical protein [Bifidobacteriaceae bacterium]
MAVTLPGPRSPEQIDRPPEEGVIPRAVKGVREVVDVAVEVVDVAVDSSIAGTTALAEPQTVGAEEAAVLEALPQGRKGATGNATKTTESEAGAGLAVAYVVAYLLMYVALMTPVMSTLAIKVGSITPTTGRVAALSIVTGVGAFFAFVANPIAGALSDRTTSRLGMRRPWLIGGVIGGALGLTIIGFATQVWMVVVGWAITQGS